ncbi:hypothetical protein HK105_208049 [Polyrhizophydium stewartii]|uniref:Ankyrin repeat protein n=1 Tax=Polyrhizophydium stewartii TaxID=2732419 RepID=A0ABR4MYW7_9FUNG
MADIRTNDAPAAALAAPPPPAQPAAAHADPAAATAQHDRLAERLDGQPAPPPAVSPPLVVAPVSTNRRPPPSTASDAARAVRFRPSAANEWDRMPAEIQDKILEHAGVLTLWVNGRIDDISKISLIQFKELLRDVFETDWQGDIAELPFGKFGDARISEPFWRLHTRSMHARVKAFGYYFFTDALEQAAILNGWTDLLDFRQTGQIGMNAARCGSIAMLRHLVDERWAVSLRIEHVCAAAEFGHLKMLKWLHERMPDGGWPTFVMDKAAYGGSLDCVKFLHANRTEGCTFHAMDWAAWNNHLAVVKFLHANRAEGCSSWAMNGAAKNGHLTIVKWLHENRTEGCSTEAMDYAARYGHADVVEFLHKNRTEGCTSYAINNAAVYGHADIVEFLHKNRTEGSIADAAELAARFGRLAVIQRIHAIAPHVITRTVADEAATRGRISLLDWIVDNASVWPTAFAILRAVKEGHFRTLSLFLGRLPRCLGTTPSPVSATRTPSL